MLQMENANPKLSFLQRSSTYFSKGKRVPSSSYTRSHTKVYITGKMILLLGLQWKTVVSFKAQMQRDRSHIFIKSINHRSTKAALRDKSP